MLETLLQQVQQTHQATFSATPGWLASAPGRVNLIGDHTDYTGGFALPFAINRYTVISASLNPDNRSGEVDIFSTLSNERIKLALGPADASSTASQWHDYIRGVLSLMHSAGFEIPGLAISVHGDLPVGSGLSSSASLELAVATLVEGIVGRSMGAQEKILLCQRAEHEYARVPCGILDQFSICEARANEGLLLDCRDQSATSVAMRADHIGFVVIDSMVRHQHSGGGYAQRRQECELAQQQLNSSLRDATADAVATLADSVLQKRAGHVVSENARVGEFSHALAQSDFVRAGELMFESHASLRDDFEVSCRDVDRLVEMCRDEQGVLGARMTGGGFGGSVIVMASPEELPVIARQIAENYRIASGFDTQPVLVDVVSGCRLHAANE